MKGVTSVNNSQEFSSDTFFENIIDCPLNLFGGDSPMQIGIINHDNHTKDSMIEHLHKLLYELDSDISEFIKILGDRYDQNQVKQLRYAYYLAALCHRGQMRKCGTRQYLEHPIRISLITHQVGMPFETILSALLHDIVEDSDIDVDTIRKIFGNKIAKIVQNITCEKWYNYIDQISKDKPEYQGYFKEENLKSINRFTLAQQEYKRTSELIKNGDHSETSNHIENLVQNIKNAAKDLPDGFEEDLKRLRDKEYYQNMGDQSSMLKVADRLDFFYTIDSDWSDDKIIEKINQTIEHILPFEEKLEKKYTDDEDKVRIRLLRIELIKLINKIINQRQLNISPIKLNQCKVSDTIGLTLGVTQRILDHNSVGLVPLGKYIENISHQIFTKKKIDKDGRISSQTSLAVQNFLQLAGKYLNM